MKANFIRALALAAAVGAVGVAACAPPGSVDAAPAGRSCVQPAAWTLLGGEAPRIVGTPEVLALVGRREVVLLGEQHDEADDHRWQLQMLAALYAQRPDMAIGFEMFPRRVQPVLDDWVAGKLTVKEFLARSEWDSVWRLPAELYLPLFEFARINRIPMVALNVDQKLIRAVSDKGWDAVPPADREGVGRAAPPSAAYRDFLFGIYGDHPAAHGGAHGGAHAKSSRDDPAFDRFVESQTTWDRAMAEAIARAGQRGPADGRRLVVGIMGSGHIRDGYGVPHQLRDLGIRSIGTLLPVDAGLGCDDLRAGLADAVFALPEQADSKPEPPRLGVRIEAKDGAVRIVSVTPGSLAERTGLKTGDRIVEMAGAPVKTTARAIATIRMQPAGTWLPLRVERGGESLDVVVKFPPRQ